MILEDLEKYFVGFLKDEAERCCAICGELYPRGRLASKHLETHGIKIMYSIFCNETSSSDNSLYEYENCSCCGNKVNGYTEDDEAHFFDYQIIKENQEIE